MFVNKLVYLYDTASLSLSYHAQNPEEILFGTIPRCGHVPTTRSPPRLFLLLSPFRRRYFTHGRRTKRDLGETGLQKVQE